MGSEGEEDQYSPLMTNFSDTDAEKPFKRTGTIWTAVAHIITGVIGAGVLSLAWSTAQLGWVAGPLIMVVFAVITILSANLLCDCYRSPDPEFGPDRNRSYMDAVQFYLGEKHKRVCGVFLNESLYGCAVAYVITSAASVKAIEKSNCFHKEGHDAPCNYGDTIFMLLFGGVQIIVSQIPDFHNMAWLSIVAAIMSFTYSFIGLGLGFAKVVENREIKGSVGGVAADSSADKVWLILQALGDIAFAYPYSVILLEIQDTLKSPPAERKTMKKASTTAIVITTFFYLCCGCFGYAAFGSDTPGNLLTGFGFYEPYWLVDFANACIVLHLVGGYQKFAGKSVGFYKKAMTGGGDDDNQRSSTPLLQSTVVASSSDESLPLDHPPLKRTGNVRTAVAHIITGVIGSGVLSLAWSMAQLGWIAGPLSMLFFAVITLLSTFLLSNCYRSPDPEYGPARNRSYLEAVQVNLGERSGWLCGLVAHISLYGIAIAYTITSAISMRAIQKSNCYHEYGHEAACDFGDTYYILIFGALQIVMSQIPNFHNMEWLSVVAAIMSFTYSFIGLGLGFAKVLGDGIVKGSIAGISTSTASQKMWLVSQAIGDIAFAYPYSVILIEIQDTLASPPPENETMKKASTIAISITTFFYLCCGGFGYAAFGDSTPGNLLTGFGFYEPYWLIDFANACIVLHLVGGYQVYSQPIFAVVEKWLAWKYPNSGFVNREYTLKFPLLPILRLNLLRLCFRTTFVVSTTVIAMIFPYFNQVLGVIGAMTFWPLSIYFPVEMYFVQRKIGAWTTTWVLLRIFSIFCFLVTTFALIGSIEGLIAAKLS